MVFRLTEGINILGSLKSDSVSINVVASKDTTYKMTMVASGFSNTTYCSYTIESEDLTDADCSMNCRIYATEFFKMLRKMMEIYPSEDKIRFRMYDEGFENEVEYECIRSIASSDVDLNTIFRSEPKVYNFAALRRAANIAATYNTILTVRNGEAMVKLSSGVITYFKVDTLPDFNVYGPAMRMLLGVTTHVGMTYEHILISAGDGAFRLAVKKSRGIEIDSLQSLIKSRSSHKYVVDFRKCFKVNIAMKYTYGVLNFLDSSLELYGELGTKCVLRYLVKDRVYGKVKSVIESGNIPDGGVDYEDSQVILQPMDLNLLKSIFNEIPEVTVSVKKWFVMLFAGNSCVILPKRVKEGVYE